MIKLIKFIQVFLILSFIILNVYLMIFNWAVYKESLEINYGFGSFTAPMVLLLVLFAIFIIFIIWLTIYIMDMKIEIMSIRSEDELAHLKTMNQANSGVGRKTILNEKIDLLLEKMDQLIMQKNKTEPTNEWS